MGHKNVSFSQKKSQNYVHKRDWLSVRKGVRNPRIHSRIGFRITIIVIVIEVWFETFSGNQQGQSYLHNNTKSLFSFSHWYSQLRAASDLPGRRAIHLEARKQRRPPSSGKMQQHRNLQQKLTEFTDDKIYVIPPAQKCIKLGCIL